MSQEKPAVLVLSIGHATRPLADFLTILKAHEVEKVADIRTVPRSRHNPQFNQETLPQALAEAGIGYVHLSGLGGLRHPRKDSPDGLAQLPPSAVSPTTCKPPNSKRICGPSST